MTLGEELRSRLQGGGIKAAELARQAGVTRQYIQRIMSGQAGTVRPETRARIMAALERMLAAATVGVFEHEGVAQLADDADLCREHGVTPAELHFLAQFVHYGPDGLPCAIKTKTQALDLLRALRPLYGPAGGQARGPRPSHSR
jgi:transcriptional regulator with XRE-family HTH domain